MYHDMGDLLFLTVGESLDEKLLTLAVILESLCSSHELQQLLYSLFRVFFFFFFFFFFFNLMSIGANPM